MKNNRYYRHGSTRIGGVIIHSDGVIERDPHASGNNNWLRQRIETINDQENRGVIDHETAERRVHKETGGLY